MNTDIIKDVIKNTEELLILSETSEYAKNLEKNIYRYLYDNQLKPALNVWNLIKLMFKNYGYTIKSDFFNTPWFKTLYMYGFCSSNSTI